MKLKQRITPFLSFKNQAIEAAEFYVSILPDSQIVRQVKNPVNDSTLTVELQLCGMRFIALNAGRDWTFNESISLAVECETQPELDVMWEKLLANGGTELGCGWLKDKFGLCWQVWPTQMMHWFSDENPIALQRMFESLWQMKRLDLANLKRAYDGEQS